MRVALRYTNDRHEADDIAQEALLRAWRRSATLRDSSSWQTWLATITRNEALRSRAKPQAEPCETIEPRQDDGDPESGVLERLRVRAALDALGPEERLLVRLRYERDMTQPAIANLLGLPEGTVKVRLHRVRCKLVRVLEN